MAESSLIKMIIEAEDRASTVFKDIDKSIGTLDSSFGGLGGRVADLVKGVTEVAAVLGALAIAFGTLAAKEAAEFETKIANISTLLDSGMDVDKISSGIMALTREIPQSAQALADAFYDIQSATGAGADGLKILDVAGKAAVGGMTDAKTAAGALTTVLNSYHLEADQAGVISDIMFGVIKEGVINYEQLAAGIGKVAAPGAAANQSFQEVGAAIATLTSVTGQQEMSFTKLNSLMGKLQMDDVQKGFAKLGVSVTTLDGEMRPLSDIIAQVSSRQLSYNQIFDALPEKTAAEGISLLSANYDILIEKLDSTTNSQGKATKAFETMADTTTSKMVIAKNAWDEFLESVGKPMLKEIKPVLADIASELQNLKDSGTGGKIGSAFAIWIDALSQVAGIIPGILDDITGTANISGVAGDGFIGWISNIENVKGILDGVVTVVGGVAMAVAMVHDAFVGVGVTIGGMLLGGLDMALIAVKNLLQGLDYVPGIDLSGVIGSLDGMIDATEDWMVEIGSSANMWSDNVMDGIVAAKNGIAGITDRTTDATKEAENLGDAHTEASEGIVENEEYAQLLAMAEQEASGEAETFGDKIEKSGKKAEVMKNDVKAATDLAIAQLKEMSDITQTQIEWDAKFNIAQLEAKSDEAKAVLDSLSDSFGSAADAASSMFGDLAGMDTENTWDKWTKADPLMDVLEEQMQIQRDLADAQIDYIDYLKSGGGLDVNVKADGGADWLTGLLDDLFEGIKTKAAGEGMRALVGVI